MKIKPEFWDLIKKGEKTIELRKVSKLRELVKSATIDGRFKIALVDGELLEAQKGTGVYMKSAYLGSITVNGYSIIKNPFKNKNLIQALKLKDWLLFWQELFEESNYQLTHLWHENNEWIIDNWNWLTDYFKDETEILVLKIESLSINNDKR